MESQDWTPVIVLLVFFIISLGAALFAYYLGSAK